MQRLWCAREKKEQMRKYLHIPVRLSVLTLFFLVTYGQIQLINEAYYWDTSVVHLFFRNESNVKMQVI